jgi:hypothetical protein
MLQRNQRRYHVKKDRFSKSKRCIQLCHSLKAAGDDNADHMRTMRDLQISDYRLLMKQRAEMIQSQQKMNTDEDEGINESTTILKIFLI